MSVDTRKVDQRRDVHYESYDDLVADARRLASSDTRTVGNWTLGQIFQHLARSLNSSIDGTEMRFPWILKRVFLLFLKKDKMLNTPVRAGFRIPKKGEAQFSPAADVTTQDGLAALEAAIERCRREPARADHVLFGPLTREEWDKFNLRHAELHMSFAVAK